jgi:RhtB (resistance to homoserine/threonine) family protein
MFDAQLLTFIAVAAVLTISPGADTLLVIRNVLAGGRKQGVLTALGICSGLFVHATLSALSLSVLLAHSALAFQLLKIVGACYLVFLGVQSLRRAFAHRPHVTEGARAKGVHVPEPRRSFTEGLLTNVLNPKVAVFYLAFLPQFISPADPVLAKSILLASIHAAMGVIWLSALAGLLDRLRAIVTRPSARRVLEGVCGSVLVGLGGRLALSER